LKANYKYEHFSLILRSFAQFVSAHILVLEGGDLNLVHYLCFHWRKWITREPMWWPSSFLSSLS